MILPQSENAHGLLKLLLQRGDRVSVTTGRLSIEPASGVPVPADWLRSNAKPILTAILSSTGTDGFFYQYFTTGCYPYQGVTLQFKTIYGQDCYAVFNASLTHERGPRKGKQYRGKQFRPRKGSEFVRFWNQCGLTYRRLSEFHDAMGKLSEIAFQGSRNNGRIDKQTLHPVSVGEKSIRRAFLPDNDPTTSRQISDNDPTTAPDKETAQAHQTSGMQPNSTAGDFQCGSRLSREHGTRDSLDTPLSPEHQSITEWLDDYESAEFNLGGIQ